MTTKVDSIIELIARGLRSALTFSEVASMGDESSGDLTFNELDYFEDDFSQVSYEKTLSVAEDFLTSCEREGILVDKYNAIDYGVDLWFTGVGHGVGFRDRDYPEKDRLDQIAQEEFGYLQHWGLWIENGEIEID